MDVVLAAGVVVTDEAGRVLLVRRGREPGRGQWSVPGGKTEPGETLAEAAVRETLEETGLHVAIGPEVLRTTVPIGDGRCYEIHDFAGTVSGGVLAAGDDAEDAGWFGPDELTGLPLTPMLLDHLRHLGVVPQSQAGEAGPTTSGSTGSAARSSTEPS